MSNIKMNGWNTKTFNDIVRLFEDGEYKVAIQQATGTGKSQIINAVIEYLKEKNNGSLRVLLLAPQVSILDQFENDYEIEAELMTYQSLFQLYKNHKDEFDDMKYDLIVTDELHRAGAQMWSKAIKQLIENNPDAKLLGATATPRRTDQNEEDMIDLMFNGNRVGNLSLTNAIKLGILPSPVYNVGFYSLNEEIDKRLEEIKNSKMTEKQKTTLRKFLEGKRVNWEESSGVDKTIQKSFESLSNKKDLKILVFATTINQINELKPKFIESFSNVFPKKNIVAYEYHTGTDESQFEKFKSNEDISVNNPDGTIKILFTVNKLNEGVHIDNLDGIIMMRQTESYIIYYQQLGRILSLGQETKHPIVLDLVNNQDSVKIANEFKKDSEEEDNLRSTLSEIGEVGEYYENMQLQNVEFHSYVEEALQALYEIDHEINLVEKQQIEYEGKMYTIRGLADLFNLDYLEVYSILKVDKLPVHVLKRISEIKNEKFDVFGEKLTRDQFAKEYGTTYEKVNYKLQHGVDLEEFANELQNKEDEE